MVNSINEKSSELEIEELYELIEDFIKENKEESTRLDSDPFIEELTQKIVAYANLKADDRMKILARFLRFTLKLKKTYTASLVSSNGSLLLRITFASERGYDLYRRDLESGEIGKQILEVLLFPPYLASFNLKPEDLIVYLNDHKLTQEQELLSEEIVRIETKSPLKRKFADTLTEASINILNNMVNSINEKSSVLEIEELYELIEDFIKENKEESTRLASDPFIEELTQKIVAYANLKEDDRMKILARCFRFVTKLKKTYTASLVSSNGSILLRITFASERGYKLYRLDLESGEIGKQILEVLLYPPYLASFNLKAEDLIVYLNDHKLTQEQGCIHFLTSKQSQKVFLKRSLVKDNVSLSKSYTSTPETTNTASLARLILGPCTDVLRDILKSEVLPSDLSRKVKEFKDKIRPKNPLYKTQSEIIFPKSTNQYGGDYSDLDISLLYILLRNVSKIAPHSKGWGEIPDPGDRSVAANIERIHFLKNQYNRHLADLSLSDSEFRQEWRNIRDIVVELERHLGSSTVYQDAVNTIKTCPMDPEQEKKYIDLLGDMKELHRTVNCISNQMQMRSFRNPTVSGKIEMIKKSITTHCEDISPLFVRTRAFEKAKELLGINGYVVIGGNPGTGKSTMANFLIKQLMEEGKDPLQLYKFKDLYKSLAPNDNIVVFMDNVFGEFSLSSDDVQDFTRTSETTKELFDTDTEKSNYLILTVRSDILKEYTSKVEDDTFFVSSLVDLSSKTYALQENEILQLAIKYDVCKNIEEKEFTRKVSEMSLPIGFPQCCKLAKDIQEDILSLAKNPVIFLTGYFDNLFEKPTAKNAVLVYILLSGGEVDFEFSDNRQMDLEKKHDSLDFIGLKTSFINDFQKSINCFDGFLTIRDSIRNSLQFSHSSVQETLFNFLFYSNPKKMIQNCHHSLLQIFTTTRKSNSTKIIIGQELFADVICRIANVITERSVAGYRSISLLELWNDSNFHEHVLETEQCTSLFKTCQDINRDSMMVHFSKAGNRRWVEYLLPNSDERQRYRSLNVACSKNHPDVVNLILASGEECDLKTCFYAVQSGNLELLLRMCELVDLHQIGLTLNPVWSDVRHSLLQEICLMRQTQFIEKISAKYPFLVGMKNSQGASVLHSVAGSGDKYAFNLLLKFELNPYEKDQESSHTILTCACQNGRLDMVKYLIGKYPALIESHIDLHGGSLFHMAAFSGKIDMFEYILSLFESENLISIESGMKPNIYTKDKIGQSILHVACRNGQLDMCKYLVSRYPKLLNDQDITGANVLHCVALSGNVHLFQYFLSKGLDITLTTHKGANVLHICCNGGREEMCRFLVNMYPDLLHVTDNKGLSVLHSASFGGNLEIISFLIKKGLDINELSNDGLNILHFACLWEKLEVCYYLLEKYPKLLDVKDKFDNSTLHYAVLSGNEKIKQLIIDKGMKIKSIEKKGETILHQVCCYGKTDHWEYLIDYYSDLLATRDNDGMTVLHSACFGGNVEIVTYLVRKGLDINAVSNDGQSILHIASKNGKYEVCDYLLDKHPHLLHIRDKTNRTVLHYAVCGGNVEILKLLIRKGIDVTSVDINGETILHLCCHACNLELCKYLVNHYSNLLKTKDNDGMTVLHSACWGGNKEIVTYLVSKGLNINAVSKDGQSILHIASRNGKYEVCEYLVNTYPHLLQVRDIFNITVLHYAPFGGNVKIVKLLIDKGIDPKSVDIKGGTVLHSCCCFGTMEMCEYLVDNFGELLDKKDNEGKTVLHSACCGENVETVTYLVRKGLDINALTNNGECMLHIACGNGKYEVCEYLLNKYPHLLHIRDKVNRTVLHDAVCGGNVEIVKLLIQKGIDVTSVDINGKTVLHLCCLACNFELCEYLVNHYSDLLATRDNDGMTVLHSACWGGNKEIVTYLVRKGLDINAVSNDGQSILHIASRNGKYEVCEYLVNTYPHLLQVRDRVNITALHYALFGGNVKIVKLLIDKGIDDKPGDINGRTVLHFCCRFGLFKMCEYLVDHFEELVDKRDNEGMTVLHSACCGGNVEIVTYLVRKGLDINALAHNGKCVLHVACQNGNFEVCEYLVNTYPHLLQVSDRFNVTALHYAPFGGNIKIVKLLIDKGIDAKSGDIDGRTVLHYCCRFGTLEMCEYLVDQCGELLDKKDNEGKTVLHSACCGGNIEILTYLVRKGLDINAVSNDGQSILHTASRNGKYEVCEYLVNKHSHLLQASDRFNVTALHYAPFGGNVKIVKLLFEKGIDAMSADINGRTVLHICCCFGNLEMCEYLVDNFEELLHKKDNEGKTVLHSACCGGNVEIVTYLVRKGLDINALANNGKCVLHVACQNGKFEVCEYLSKKFPHLLSIKDSDGNSVIEAAYEIGDIDMIQLFMKNSVISLHL